MFLFGHDNVILRSGRMHTHCLTNQELPDALLKFCTISGIHASWPAARPAGEIFSTCTGSRIEIRLRPAHRPNFSASHPTHTHTSSPRSYVILQARLLRQKTENRYLTVLVASWGVNSCRKALFGVISRPDTPSAVFAGETVELW